MHFSKMCVPNFFHAAVMPQLFAPYELNRNKVAILIEDKNNKHVIYRSAERDQ